MALEFANDILPETVGLRLCKVVGDDVLRISEDIKFTGGRSAVLTTLNRAHVSGHVGGAIDTSTNFWADQLNEQGDNIGEIRLDRGSWNSLKTKWMKCKMLPA